MADAKDSTERELRHLWSQCELRNLLKKAVCLCPDTAETMAEHAKIMKLPPQYWPQMRNIARFKRTDQKRLNSALQATGLLLVLIDLLEGISQRNRDQNECLAEMKRSLRRFCDQLPEEFPGHKLNTITSRYGDSLVGSLLELIASQFQIADDQFRDLARYFFPGFDPDTPPDTPLRRYYNTYRFHSTNKKIVKTFTMIVSPSKAVPACMFSNFFVTKRSDVPRRSTGIIVPTPRAIYFSGGMMTGAGLKFMVVERLKSPPNHLNGLVITQDDDDSLVGARVVLASTDKATHTEAGAGIYDMDKLKEVRPFLDELRNRIPFKLEKEIYMGKKQLSQAAMVDEVRRAFDKRPAQALVDKGKRPFNPAADEEYTFNAALRIWNEREKP